MSIEAYFRGGGDEEKELPEVVEDLRDELYLIRRELSSLYSKIESSSPIDGITVPIADYYELLAIKKMYLNLVQMITGHDGENIKPSYDPLDASKFK